MAPRSNSIAAYLRRRPAARNRAPRDFRKELPFRDVGVGELELAGNVLHQDFATEEILRLADVGAYDIERLLGIGQRQQVVQMTLAGEALLADQERAQRSVARD